MPVLYEDPLVRITDDGIRFSGFHFFVGKKFIPFSGVEKVVVLDNSLATGKWRIHGSGDFRHWFPLDWRRPGRDRIFILFRKDAWWRVGFTAESGQTVQAILKARVPVSDNRRLPSP
ncbi:MAG: hypothetical protein KKA60_05015 [Proteobacteria bacterium]|nr:hypothetical protein [Pseudomonadota bacterium]